MGYSTQDDAQSRGLLSNIRVWTEAPEDYSQASFVARKDWCGLEHDDIQTNDDQRLSKRQKANKDNMKFFFL